MAYVPLLIYSANKYGDTEVLLLINSASNSSILKDLSTDTAAPTLQDISSNAKPSKCHIKLPLRKQIKDKKRYPIIKSN